MNRANICILNKNLIIRNTSNNYIVNKAIVYETSNVNLIKINLPLIK